MKERDKTLGMAQPISRRDFMGGVSIALSGSLLGCPWVESAEVPSGKSPSVPRSDDLNRSYPPVRSGLRGSHSGSFEVAHRLRDGYRWAESEISPSGEVYDLIVVGGGLSGLSAAWFYREAKPDARILILENHDDFGGHAKRNEFWHEDRMFLGHGGTINIEDFNEYGEAAQRMIRSLGIDPSRYGEFVDRELYPSLGLRDGFFFDGSTFGVNRLVVSSEEDSIRQFLSDAPLPEATKENIAHVYETQTDYLAGMDYEEKQKKLQGMSYQRFLVDYVGATPESLRVLNQTTYWAIGIDGLSAWAAAVEGAPGTEGLGLEEEDGESGSYFQFPDGNASIARLLVRSLIPQIAAGSTMEDVVTSPFDYAELDRDEAPIRIRLDSTVVRVQHLGKPEEANEVEITYVHEGKAHSVRSAHTVLACYNTVIPYLCDELPEEQNKALSQSLKAPLVYVNVLIRNWKAFLNLGVQDVNCPGCYFDSFRLSTPVSMGDYLHSKNPEEPVVVHMFRVPLAPGRSAQEQWKAGRYNLLSTTFETFEREIREQLDRVLGPGGFDSSRDIEAITVNRWPHGYAYGQDPTTGEIAYMLDELDEETAPWVKGRKRFGRIAIANSDAAATAMTEGAVGQAHRAVTDLI